MQQPLEGGGGAQGEEGKGVASTSRGKGTWVDLQLQMDHLVHAVDDLGERKARRR